MINPKKHAQLSVVLSILKAFKLAELLTVLNNLLAIFAIAYSPTFTNKLLAMGVLSVGLSIFYFALRIRIDVTLFARWDSLDIADLDEALIKINPKYQKDRTLESRLQGSYQLFNRGLLMLGVQFLMIFLAVYLA